MFGAPLRGRLLREEEAIQTNKRVLICIDINVSLYRHKYFLSKPAWGNIHLHTDLNKKILQCMGVLST